MARLARVVLPGVPHHITQRGVRSIDIFSNDNDRKQYLEFVRSASEEFGLTVLSYCLMSNHVHLLVIPENEESLSRGIGAVHRKYSRMINFREKTRGFLFQGRFFSCPLDNRHLVAAASYVELNPVRAGICSQASEYEWSSAKFHLGLESNNLLVKDREWYGSTDDWEKLLKNKPKEIDLLRKHFRTGRPLGNEKFLIEAENITGRDLISKKPGRKRN
ncbi:transposase [bacterium]|nr:transposase [bacterium]